MMVVCVASAVLVLLAAVPAQAVQAAQADSALLRTIQQVDFTKLLNASRAALSGQCKDDLHLYFGSILKEGWAQQMLDSSAKIPEAVLWGNMYFMGMFDECVAVAVAAGPGHDFTGKHCLLYINTTTPAMIAGLIPVVFRYGLCVPSSCSGPELQTVLNFAVSALTDHKLQVYLPEQYCATGDPPQLRAGDWAVVAFLIAVGLVAAGSTWLDLRGRARGKPQPHPALTAFSLYSNTQRLLAVTSGPLDCLQGLRTVSLMWVVLCHAYYNALLHTPAANTAKLESVVGDITKMPIVNGFVAADTFFFISGLLVCLAFFRDTERKGCWDAPLAVVRRYIRLTPPLAAMILLQVTILLYLGDGPLWSQTAGGNAAMCEDSWWSSLLYVQNYVHPNSTCLGQSWYLSADMQMSWLAPLVLYPLYLWPAAGRVCLAVVTLAAVWTNFGIAYTNTLGPSIYQSKNKQQTEMDYTPLHTRITPWLVGLALGNILSWLKARKDPVRLSKAVVALGWFLSTAVCLAVIYSYMVFLGKKHYAPVEVAFYLPFHRLGWALGMAWVVFACFHGYGGPVNGFLSWSAFKPLGRLVYCSFLMLSSVQFHRIGIMRINNYIGDVEIVYLFLGDWLLATLLSVPLTLLFELPFCNLARLLGQRGSILPWPRQPGQGRGKADTGHDTPSTLSTVSTSQDHQHAKL